MKEQFKSEISSLSNNLKNEIYFNYLGSKDYKVNKKNSYSLNNYYEKSMDNNNYSDNFKNNIFNIKNQNINDSSITTETSKIKLIKNPPNLLKLCNNENDDNLKIYNENIKLGSELTLEKSKVIKLNNLLKEKEKENIDLKKKIEELETNLNNLEKEYKINFEQKVDLIYKNNSLEKNHIKQTYEAIQRCKDKEILKMNKEINNIKTIINLFFDFYNKKIGLLTKTQILSKRGNNIISLDDDNNNYYKNSLFIINSFEELIKKLINDNKILYDELVKYKDVYEKYEELEINKYKNGEQNKNNIYYKVGSIKKKESTLNDIMNIQNNSVTDDFFSLNNYKIINNKKKRHNSYYYSKKKWIGKDPSNESSNYNNKSAYYKRTYSSKFY